MNAPISFSNLGIGEIALVLAAVLLLFGVPTGIARSRTGLHTELRRQHYLLGWILAGLTAGVVTTAWTAPLQLGASEAVAAVVGGLVLVATVAMRQPHGIRRAPTAISVAAFSVSWVVAMDLATLWVARSIPLF
jgi:hypothetical protein